MIYHEYNYKLGKGSKKNNTFIHLLLKCRSAPPTEFYLNNTTSIPILNRGNKAFNDVDIFRTFNMRTSRGHRLI